MHSKHKLFYHLQDSDILNLGTGSISWFEVNGYGCKPTYPTNITSEDPYRLVRPEYVEGCLLEYYTIEIIHSSVQLLLAVNQFICEFKREKILILFTIYRFLVCLDQCVWRKFSLMMMIDVS